MLQDDRMLATETVRETLMFSAKMRLPPTTPKEEIEKRISVVLNVWRVLDGVVATIDSVPL